MTDHFEARVIKAISETMTCDKCPHPCIAKQHSTMYNCAKQWGYILSQIDIKSDLKEILDDVYTIWNREHNPVTYCADNIAYEEEEQILKGFAEMMKGFWNNQNLEVPNLETPCKQEPCDDSRTCNKWSECGEKGGENA